MVGLRITGDDMVISDISKIISKMVCGLCGFEDVELWIQTAYSPKTELGDPRDRSSLKNAEIIRTNAELAMGFVLGRDCRNPFAIARWGCYSTVPGISRVARAISGEL